MASAGHTTPHMSAISKSRSELRRPSRRWHLKDRRWKAVNQKEPDRTFTQYDVHVDTPSYDEEVYENNLTHTEWTMEETDYLMTVYREANGKWPIIVDRYDYEGSTRSMEDLKSRFYTVSATVLRLQTPVSSMTATDFTLYETLSKFNPKQEASRKQLAEGHLYRGRHEVDEESVLLNELQRIMLQQSTIENEREDLRRRLDYPRANTNGYQYNSSSALTQLWQQLLATDRMKKNQRLRPTGHPGFDGFNSSTSARPRDSNVGLDTNLPSRRGTRDSLPSATPQNALPVDLSAADMVRFGVVQNQDKLPSGVTFASDRLTKPRVAKSTVQTDKIATILQHAGVPELIPLPTPAVIEQFETIMVKVHTLLDIRKLAEKEEQELKVLG